MKKTILMIALLCTALYAQAQNKSNKDTMDIIPLVYGNGLFLEEQTVRGLGGGVIVLSSDFDDRDRDTRNATQLVALYTRHDLMEEGPEGCPDGFNNLDLLLQKKVKSHQFFSLLKSYSDEPVYGGIETFDFVTGYGYEIINRSHHSLWLGASLAISDWGPVLPGGGETPVLPLPFLHYDFYSEGLNLSFDFTTSPMLDLVLFPDSRVRFNGSTILCDVSKWQDAGIKYDMSLEYRFFSDAHALGDFAGVRLGYMAEDYEYDLADRGGESLQVAWKSVYGTLDLSLLELTAAYAFDGRQYYDDEKSSLGAGWSLNLQLAWLF